MQSIGGRVGVGGWKDRGRRRVGCAEGHKRVAKLLVVDSNAVFVVVIDINGVAVAKNIK